MCKTKETLQVHKTILCSSTGQKVKGAFTLMQIK